MASSRRGNSETTEFIKEIDYYTFLKVTNLLTHALVLAPSWLPLQTLLQEASFPADLGLAPADFQADDCAAKRWWQ